MSYVRLDHRRSTISFSTTELPAVPGRGEPSEFKRFEIKDLDLDFERALRDEGVEIVGVERVGSRYIVTWFQVEQYVPGGGS